MSNMEKCTLYCCYNNARRDSNCTFYPSKMLEKCTTYKLDKQQKTIDAQKARIEELEGERVERIRSASESMAEIMSLTSSNLERRDALAHMCYIEYEKHDYIRSIHKPIVIKEMNRRDNKIEQLEQKLKELERENERIEGLRSLYFKREYDGRKKIKELKKELDAYLELTRELDEHPESFEYGCLCRTCMSYAEDDGDE